MITCIRTWSYTCHKHVMFKLGLCYMILVCRMLSFQGKVVFTFLWGRRSHRLFLTKKNIISPLVTSILIYITIKQAWPQWCCGRKGLTHFVWGLPNEIGIQYSTLVIWLRGHHETIITKGICDGPRGPTSKNMTSACLTIRLFLMVYHCNYDTWGW